MRNCDNYIYIYMDIQHVLHIQYVIQHFFLHQDLMHTFVQQLKLVKLSWLGCCIYLQSSFVSIVNIVKQG